MDATIRPRSYTVNGRTMEESRERLEDVLVGGSSPARLQSHVTHIRYGQNRRQNSTSNRRMRKLVEQRQRVIKDIDNLYVAAD
jgi:hypothetical protein